jgi:hypothetical protein
VVQVLATAEHQAASNVYSLVERFLTLNDNAAADRLNIDVGKTRLYSKGSRGAELRPVTSAAEAREGQRLTFGLADESQLLLPSAGGVELARTLMRNAAKMDGRTLELSNAFLAGASSVAERTRRARERGVMLYAITPSRVPEFTEPDGMLLEMLDEIYEGCHWVDTRRLLEEIRDPAVPWEDSRRFYNASAVPARACRAVPTPHPDRLRAMALHLGRARSAVGRRSPGDRLQGLHLREGPHLRCGGKPEAAAPGRVQRLGASGDAPVGLGPLSRRDRPHPGRATLKGTRPQEVQSATGFYYIAVVAALTAEIAVKTRFFPV